jgi:superfamily II DNA or RNA helicase
VSRQLVFGWGDQPLARTLLHDLATARQVDIAVAFVLESGLSRIEPFLQDVLDRGGQIRFLTGDYLYCTEPPALLRLLDLAPLNPDGPGTIVCRVFEANGDVGFHPKAYLLHGLAAYVGSSNLSRRALEEGVEWNLRVEAPAAIAALTAEFEKLFTHPRTTVLTPEWIKGYATRRHTAAPRVLEDVPTEAPLPPPEPHAIQVEALVALAQTRTNGNCAGLVVLATGLGKTWLSAFDSRDFKRILFVAHREEILRQAKATFRRIRPDAVLGDYTGETRDLDADVVLASVQTLGKKAHLERFAVDAFDYIVVDEFHHAAASTYRRLIDYFEPRFLLGLTATPDRTDGADILTLCGENLVYQCDIVEGIRRVLLSPFHYFGVADSVDFENIPWRNGRFDAEVLEQAVATHARAQNAFEQWHRHAPRRTLAFCVSQRHADFMRRFFAERGVRVAAVHAGDTSDPRAESLERLAEGTLQVVFAVDMFNEGVDVPAIDAVLLLRPTESRILWLQQIGRGLRRAEGKSNLTIIDYIGNHRTFLKSPMLLLPGAGERPAEIAMALDRYERGELDLPPGCEVTYELEAVTILRALLRVPKGVELMRIWYVDFKARNGRRPAAVEAWHAGYDPGSLRASYGSWLGFVRAEGDLTAPEREAFQAEQEFFESVDITPMTRSYKMLLLLGMLASERFPGEIGIDELTRAFAHQARRSALLQQDVGDRLGDPSMLRSMLVENPIAAWTGGKGTGGRAYFVFTNDVFRSNLAIPPSASESAAEIARELCEWRLAQYLDRLRGEHGEGPRIVCRVARNASGDPMLFLPARERHPNIPEGWRRINIDGELYEAKFVQIAINVVRRPGSEANLLPEILRRWFGPNAGESGTRAQQVFFELVADTYHARPLAVGSELTLWQEYARADIPGLWGVRYQENVWRQGFVWQGNHMFLLVTLEKEGMQEAHRYADRFLNPGLFEWQSQNRTTQVSKAGQALMHQREQGISVHLFVRRWRKTQRGTAAPFTYCGDVTFESWKGDAPITIRWRLPQPLDSRSPLLGFDQ